MIFGSTLLDAKMRGFLRGGAVYVATIKMKMACQYLERYWKAGHRDLFEKLYQQTLMVIDDTVKTINQWLSNKK